MLADCRKLCRSREAARTNMTALDSFRITIGGVENAVAESD